MKSKATWFILAGLIVLLAAGLIVYLGYSYQIIGKKVAETRQQKSKKPPKKTPPSIEAQQTEQRGTPTAEGIVYTNQRFGFRVTYPNTWSGRESQNGDGITLTVPNESGVVVRVYGFGTTEFSLPKVVADQEGFRRSNHPDFTVLNKDETTVDEHPAIEAIWSYSASAADSPLSGTVKERTVYTIKGEAVIAFECVAEETKYSQHESVFTNLINSLKLR